MNHTITLTPRLNVAQSPAPTRLSLTRVLWYKVLRWIDKSSAQALVKCISHIALIAAVITLTFAPSFALGYLTAVLQWNSYRIPICIAAVALAFNARRILRFARRSPRAHGNQHTYHGLAVPDLAAFLQETGAFKREEALHRLGLSQGQYAKISQELEQHGVLHRGEANARILRPIGREHLIAQLRDGFPLVWDETRAIWVERDGAFARWTLDREFTQRKLDETVARKERKLKRLEEHIAGAREMLSPSPFAQIQAMQAE